MKRLVVCSMLLAGSLAAQDGWKNPVRVTLQSGKPVVAATIVTNSVDAASQAAGLGFDLLWIEMEHSPITLETARNMILATRGQKAVPFIRVPVNDFWTAKRALDIGALGVIFPFTSTPELARQAVAACKYPPLGRRGAGPGLATLRWPAPEGYASFADANAMVVIIIEEASAVDKIEEIAAVPGIDVIFIGTNDLSYSLGLRGNMDHPKHVEAVRKIVAAAKKNGIPVGRPALPGQVKDLLAQGFTFFQGGSELSFMAAGSRPLLEALGKSAPDNKGRPLY